MLANHESCTGCSACFASCSFGAISLLPDGEGFLAPKIDGGKCVQCGACERACPVNSARRSARQEAGADAIESYAAMTKNEQVRMQSSSGGVFTELAMRVIEDGGCVFGCVLDSKLVACHAKIEDERSLARLRGSKYVQSDLRDTFRECERELANGRRVLFSGTPCQIAGLRSFLEREYDGLLTVDVICHGVPSPLVFECYKQNIEKRVGAALCGVSFRDKRISWKRFSMSHHFQDVGKDFSETHDENIYLRVFLRNLCLRKSCAACQFRAGRSGADITIADFWGVERHVPEFSDCGGVSAVIVHTTKGERLLKDSDAFLIKKSVRLAQITEDNPSYYKSVQVPEGRDAYLAQCGRNDFISFSIKALKGSIWRRILRKSRQLIRRWIDRRGEKA